MFEIGQIFNKNGKEYIVVDVLNINSKEYVLFATEASKIEYTFYEVVNRNSEGLDLEEVIDSKIKNELFDAFMSKK